MTEPVVGDLVFIVEDDAAIAEGLALNLKFLGYRSEVIGDGETAHRRIVDSAWQQAELAKRWNEYVVDPAGIV